MPYKQCIFNFVRNQLLFCFHFIAIKRNFK
jgi:hypothetical protein